MRRNETAGVLQTTSLARACGAPKAHDGNTLHSASNPTSAKSPRTVPIPRIRSAATFSTTTNRGRNSRMTPGIFSPQSAAFPSDASSLTCIANVLTGESPANHIDRPITDWRKRLHVVMAPNLRPPPCKYLSREWIYLHLPLAGHPSPLETQVETANPGEQRTECHRLHLSRQKHTDCRRVRTAWHCSGARGLDEKAGPHPRRSLTRRRPTLRRQL